MNTQDINKKELYEPFSKPLEDPKVTAMRKGTEEKTYILLYYNMEYEEYKYKKFTGRYDTYFGIRDILESESVDLIASKVLVETVAIDPKTNNPKRYLISLDDASNIKEFCAAMEKYFGDNAYSLEPYDTGYTIAAKEEKEESNEIDYATLHTMLNRKSAEKEIVEKGMDEDIAKSLGIPQYMIPDNANDLFIPNDQTKELGKQFFTSANMKDDVQSKEI